MYEVRVKKKVFRGLSKLPKKVQESFRVLVEDLRDKGPIQKKWPNYSALGQNRHHCHLSYRYVACWTHERETIEIEVYYAGSREDAPY